MTEDIIYQIGIPNFFKMIHNLYDEIFIYDNAYKIIYVNQAVQRHYGLSPDELVGKSFFDFINETSDTWSQSMLPLVYENKKTMINHQSTNLNSELITIATPLFDKNGTLEYVLMSVRDSINQVNLDPSKDILLPEQNSKKLSIIAESANMKGILNSLKKLGRTDATCTFVGESGIGKTMLARYCHENSPRQKKPFVSVNCASIPKDLIESELFGYVAGAFTSASKFGKQGLFEKANGGTILLDEIGELPYNTQAKLLHVLQDKEFFPLGSTKSIQVDVKIISATNRDLKKMVEDGLFRTDLYYRINTFEITITPLRQRLEDLKKLIYYFLNTHCKKYNTSRELSPAAFQLLCDYQWPGNIRELNHILESIVVLSEDICITENDLPSTILYPDKNTNHSYNFSLNNENFSIKKEKILSSSISLDARVSELEKQIIVEAYKRFKTTRRIAQYLNISQTRASKLIRKYIDE